MASLAGYLKGDASEYKGLSLQLETFLTTRVLLWRWCTLSGCFCSLLSPPVAGAGPTTAAATNATCCGSAAAGIERCYGLMFRPPEGAFIAVVPAKMCPAFLRRAAGSEGQRRDLSLPGPRVPTRAAPEKRSRCCRVAFDFVSVFLGSIRGLTLLRSSLTGRDPVSIKQRGSLGSLVAQHLNAGNKTFLSF